MPEYILFLAKLREERRKTFYEWASIDLSSKLFLTCRGNFKHYKSVQNLIPTLPVGIGNTQAISKQIRKLSFHLSVQKLCSLLGQSEEVRKVFLAGCKKGATLWGYPREQVVVISDEKVSPFAKLEIFLPFLCFLLDALTNKHWRASSSMINLWIDPRTCQK